MIAYYWHMLASNKFGVTDARPLMCRAMFDDKNITLPWVGYYAEFGRSKSNGVGTGTPKYFRAMGHALRFERSTESRSYTYVGHRAEVTRSRSTVAAHVAVPRRDSTRTTSLTW